MHELWFALLIVSALVAVVLIEKIRDMYKAHKANQKTRASEPIDATDWLTYDSAGSIKERIKANGHELRLLRGRRKSYEGNRNS